MSEHVPINTVPCVEAYHHLCQLNSYRVAISMYGYPGLHYINHAIGIESVNFFGTGIFRVSPYTCKPLIGAYSDNILMSQGSLDWDIIYGKIEDNLLPIVAVDVYELPYKIHYKKTHGSHLVILNGYSDVGVHVIDWYAPEYYCGWVDFQTMNKARTSSGFNDKLLAFTENDIHANWYYIVNQFRDQNAKESLFSVLSFCVKAMLSQSDDRGLNFLNRLSGFIDKNTFYCEEMYSNLLKSLYYLELERRIHRWYVIEMSKTAHVEIYTNIHDKIDQIVKGMKNLVIKSIKLESNLSEKGWSTRTQELYKLNADLMHEYIRILESWNVE